jgi:hypothetical protein
MNALSGRKKEIWDMAALMADQDDPTEREIAIMLKPAREVVNNIDWALKAARGEATRPSKNLRDWLEELKEEIAAGDFGDDEED